MPQVKWNQEQIIGTLKQVEAGRTVVEVCREYGVGERTFYKWTSKYGGLEVNEARRLKSLEDETPGSSACWRIRCSPMRL